ncbi:acetyl-CoA carboxylase biotin carboxylase subunit family protein [Streptomyces sp. NPDC056672]|uniref:ATP-grasp domain-containing protein n=1 Tax=Streptomyces sp. NPDC056672 TaxID=3345906 RepID=UPI0036C83D01
MRGYDPAAFGTTAVLDTRDEARLDTVARRLAREKGIENAVALHEKDVLRVARIREEFALGGMGVAETFRFRDKLLMKDILAEDGYSNIPRYVQLSPGEPLPALDWRGAGVVKGRMRMGAMQVRIVESKDAAERAVRELSADDAGPEIEEYVEGAMYHCDSVVHGGKVLFSSASEYLTPCANYRDVAYNGSFLLTDGPVRDEVVREAEEAIRILGLTSGVTHIEFIRRPSGELVFCEAAARPAGGSVDETIRRTYGVNVVHASVELQCGVAPTLPAVMPDVTTVAGVVWIYRSRNGGDRPAPHVKTLPGVASYDYTFCAGASVSRHVTDYAHKVVITGRDREELDAVLESVLPHVVVRAEDRVAPPRSTRAA